MDEKKLINDILAGDTHKFENIVSEYKDRLYIFLYRLSFNEAVSEEILQQTFLKAFRYLNTCDPEKGLKNWLYRIARNCYYDHFRKEKKFQLVNLDDMKFFLSSDEISTEDKAISRNELKKVIKILYELPPKYSEVMILRYVEDKTYEEIATILDLPEGTVKIRIHRARKKLKEIVYPDEK
ncbi:MAG: RNA polymerase sigma factor [Candidatus Muiribacteriaceae bacterium]